MATKLEELPKPMQDWLGEIESFDTRETRLYYELRAMPPERMLDWLLAAYELGQKSAAPPSS